MKVVPNAIAPRSLLKANFLARLDALTGLDASA